MRKRETLKERIEKLQKQREQLKAKLQRVEAKITEFERKQREEEERELLALLRSSRLSAAEIREFILQRQNAEMPDVVNFVDRRSE